MRTEANDFEEGDGVGAEVNTAADEVEPWIDDECSRMYFRRIAAGQSNDAGTIYVAE